MVHQMQGLKKTTSGEGSIARFHEPIPQITQVHRPVTRSNEAQTADDADDDLDALLPFKFVPRHSGGPDVIKRAEPQWGTMKSLRMEALNDLRETISLALPKKTRENKPKIVDLTESECLCDLWTECESECDDCIKKFMPAPKGALTIKASPIHGRGLFANAVLTNRGTIILEHHGPILKMLHQQNFFPGYPQNHVNQRFNEKIASAHCLRSSCQRLHASMLAKVVGVSNKAVKIMRPRPASPNEGFWHDCTWKFG